MSIGRRSPAIVRAAITVFTPFVQPEVFARLVADAVLERVYGDERGEVYRVSQTRSAQDAD